jgi:hypothetical protein
MRLEGHEAIEYAEAHGLTLSKYSDPTEDARDGLTLDEARAVAREDPMLVYMESAPAPGFYGNDAETVLVDRDGVIWLVQSPDTDRAERLKELPAGMRALPESVCSDLALPEEANW